MTTGRTQDRIVACVESPAQLLNVIEWAYAVQRVLPGRPIGAGMLIMVLPPPEPAARVQLHAVADLASECGFAVTWHEVRGGRSIALRSAREIRSRVTRADTVIIGDPFSRFLQLIIGFTRNQRLVVVDDGSATLAFVDLMTDGRRLVRWHHEDDHSAIAGAVADRARRRLAGGHRRGHVRQPATVFTAMPIRSAALPVVPNRLGWARRRFAAPRLIPGTDLVGTSLSDTGVIDEDAYLGVVKALADREGVGRYLAHRKESNRKLAKINDLGLTVLRPDYPLELFARIGPLGERVISFPSTVVHTLPLALADTRVEVSVCDLDQHWFSPGRRSGRSRTFLTSVTDSARRTHGLNLVAGPA
jgi:hypothetical protein